MPSIYSILLLLLIDLCVILAYPKRVTFELGDGESRCFHEELSPKKYAFMYQVIHGGQLDIGLKLFGPDNKIIAEEGRGSHDDLVFDVKDHNGSYSFCFDNEFSSISHKLIYFELRPEAFESLADEAGLPHPTTALTMVESQVELIHLFLSRAETLQVELKNREIGDRMVAEDLNQAVLVWSAAVTVAIVLTTVTQVTVLKNLFSDKKPRNVYRMPS